jgi:hypothetical protein
MSIAALFQLRFFFFDGRGVVIGAVLVVMTLSPQVGILFMDVTLTCKLRTGKTITMKTTTAATALIQNIFSMHAPHKGSENLQW